MEMIRRARNRLGLAAVCLGIVMAAQAAAAEPRYALTVLRPLPGSGTSQAQFGINQDGASVGTSGGSGSRFATRWDRFGVPTLLQRPANGIFSRASDINRCGVVVGAVDTTGQTDLTGLRATRWTHLTTSSYCLPKTGLIPTP